jgi:dTDP-4-amino-4,6-dideoxygalactose transaminase
MAIGRPSLYSIPASMPFLKLGETIYKEAHEPRSISQMAAAIASETLAAADTERANRANRVSVIVDMLDDAPGLDVVRPIANGQSGYLRLPVLDTKGRAAAPNLGIVRSYPRPLGEEPVARQLLEPGEPATPGARTVCARLFTLPTHERVNGADREQLAHWARR